MALNRRITIRTIQIALGSLWLLDGLLQLQRQMFTSNFATQVIAPAAQGQPAFVSSPIHLFIHIFLWSPALFNSFVALVQISLGVLILYNRTVKVGLLASMAWGLFVWTIGEGYGGIFSSHTILLMGAPGAAILYVLLAWAVLPKIDKTSDKKRIQYPAFWLVFVWAIVWVGGGVYQLLPGQNSVSDVSSMIAGNASGQPGWLASLDNHVGSVINGFGNPTTSMSGLHMTTNQMAQMQTQQNSGYWFILILALVQIAIGFAILLPKYYRNAAIIFGIIISLVFWVVGQSFGAIFSGLATDPNSAILFILLAMAILARPSLDEDLNKFFVRAEDIIA
jgi:hypothetical protein